MYYQSLGVLGLTTAPVRACNTTATYRDALCPPTLLSFRGDGLNCTLCCPVSAFQAVAALARSPHPRYSMALFLFWLQFLHLCRPHVNDNPPRSLFPGTEA